MISRIASGRIDRIFNTETQRQGDAENCNILLLTFSSSSAAQCLPVSVLNILPILPLAILLIIDIAQS
jgi:hypothetical protein